MIPAYFLSSKRIYEIALAFFFNAGIYWAFFYIYKHSVSPVNAYHGFEFNDLPFGLHALAIGLYLLPLLWLPVRPKKPSDMAVWFLYMFSYAPTTFICFHVMKNPFPNGIWLLLTLLFGLVCIDLARRHRLRLSHQVRTQIVLPLDSIIFAFSIALCIYILYLASFQFNLNFANVYERRLEVRDSAPLLSGYILALGRSVIIIFSVYLILAKKKRLFLVTLIILSLGLFSYDGTKNSIFVPAFLTLTCLLLKRERSNLVLNLILLLAILISIIEFWAFDSIVTSTVFTRRVFAVPGFLNSLFWEHYSEHSKVMMSDSIGQYWSGASGATSPTFAIGERYFGNPETNANTGIWMGSYAHFGFAGVVIVSVIAGFILGLIDNLTKEKFAVLGFLACSYIGILWCEQMLHTSMLTGGVFYILIFLSVYCHPRFVHLNYHWSLGLRCGLWRRTL